MADENNSNFTTATPVSPKVTEKKERRGKGSESERKKKTSLSFYVVEFRKKDKKSKAKHTQETLTQGDMVLKRERFSFKCRKTKTKVISLTNHKRRRQCSEPIRTQSKYM